jgi:hypothetical protein
VQLFDGLFRKERLLTGILRREPSDRGPVERLAAVGEEREEP